MSVYVGIDWSVKKHDVAIINEAGSIIARLTIAHQASGFEKLNKTREQVGVEATECLVGLETAHNLLIDYLWGQGYEQVYVIPPSVVKSSRGPSLPLDFQQKKLGQKRPQYTGVLFLFRCFPQIL